MASARSGGRAGPRAEEANGDLDRSLQQMLRAIAEERSRAGLRQEISGLGESGRAGSERGVPGRGDGEPGGPSAAAGWRGAVRPGSAAGGGGLETCWVAAGRGAAAGMGPFCLPKSSPRRARREQRAVCPVVCSALGEERSGGATRLSRWISIRV